MLNTIRSKIFPIRRMFVSALRGFLLMHVCEYSPGIFISTTVGFTKKRKKKEKKVRRTVISTICYESAAAGNNFFKKTYEKAKILQKLLLHFKNQRENRC